MGEPLNKCVWMWAGLLTYRLCDRGYQCASCPVERLFHPAPAAPFGPVPVLDGSARNASAALEAAPDRFHDPQHLWLRILAGGRAQVGVDPMAARLLESATGFTLPEGGRELQQGEPAITAHLAGRDVVFLSPISGVVERVHAAFPRRIPRMLSRPYGRAWMLILKSPRLEGELDQFLIGQKARARLAHDWSGFLEECLKLAGSDSSSHPVLPDGGEIDLARLEQTARPLYLTMVCRWIGEARMAELGGWRLSRRPAREGSVNDGGPEPAQER